MSESLPIQIERCQLSRVGAQFQDNLTVSEWMSIGKKLNAIGSCYQFLLGDWLNFGERQYGEKYRVACEETGLDIQTLTNYSWVCSKVEISRRREILTYSHHLEVASLSIKEQDEWLNKAEANKWSVSELRQGIRQSQATLAGEDHGKPVKTFAGYLSNAIRLIGQQSDQIANWSSEQKFRTKQLLEPIVEFYQKL